MDRVTKFLTAIRRPSIVVITPGDVVLINGKAFAVKKDHLQRLTIKKP